MPHFHIDFFKFLRSLTYAWKGLVSVFRTENNAKIHFVAGIFIICISLYTGLKASEWLWISLSIAIMWITESINTAIEELVNHISMERSERAGRIKDIAAAAVLVAAVHVVICFLLIFIPYWM